jgi:hypothetical protein
MRSQPGSYRARGCRHSPQDLVFTWIRKRDISNKYLFRVFVVQFFCRPNLIGLPSYDISPSHHIAYTSFNCVVFTPFHNTVSPTKECSPPVDFLGWTPLLQAEPELGYPANVSPSSKHCLQFIQSYVSERSVSSVLHFLHKVIYTDMTHSPT